MNDRCLPFLIAWFSMGAGIVLAQDFEPVVVEVAQPSVWTGQRVDVAVEIRVSGTFGSATTFDFPEIPSVIMAEQGGPTVSSEEIAGDSYFVRRHLLVLYCQASGTVVVPEFPVRYGVRDGFTGPVRDVTETVPSFEVIIRRPPGTEAMGFLVASESLAVGQTWQPAESDGPIASVVAGSVFKRTITQQAGDVAAIALPPPPRTGAQGVRVYAGSPVITTERERGDTTGTRSDTLSYLFQEPGTVTLPSIRYAWWNPSTETLESKTLDGITVDVIPAASDADNQTAAAPAISWTSSWWPFALAAAVLVVASWLIAVRRRLVGVLTRIRNRLDPPWRRTRRRMLAACRHGDPASAYRYWLAWPNRPNAPELLAQVHALESVFYGNRANGRPPRWQPDRLAREIRRSKRSNDGVDRQLGALPPLNPKPQ